MNKSIVSLCCGYSVQYHSSKKWCSLCGKPFVEAWHCKYHPNTIPIELKECPKCIITNNK